MTISLTSTYNKLAQAAYKTYYDGDTEMITKPDDLARDIADLFKNGNLSDAFVYLDGLTGDDYDVETLAIYEARFHIAILIFDLIKQ